MNGGLDFFGMKNSDHIQVDVGGYWGEKSSPWMNGVYISAGVIAFDDGAQSGEAYLGLSYSRLLIPTTGTIRPFLRGDLGLIGFAWPSDVDDDDEDSVDVSFIGLNAKLGGGFLVELGSFSFSLQVLYTGHLTTSGTDHGFEIQFVTFF